MWTVYQSHKCNDGIKGHTVKFWVQNDFKIISTFKKNDFDSFFLKYEYRWFNIDGIKCHTKVYNTCVIMLYSLSV